MTGSQPNQRQNRLVALAPRLPRFVRLFTFWLLKQNPHWFKELQGTTQITSVGMFGEGGGWGISFLPSHTLGITVGGISRKPVFVDGQLVEREYLHLTIAFDHDIVDGAPAARFAKRFLALLKEATVLEALEDES